MRREVAVEPPRTETEPLNREQARLHAAAVEREVRVRDLGKCQYRLESGKICGSTHRHTKNHADDGVATVHALSLRCRKHNRAASERDFGDGVVAHCISRRRGHRRAADLRQPGLPGA